VFVLSFGMQKSASLLLTRYTIDLVRAVLPSNGQKAFEELISRGVIPGVGCFPWKGWQRRPELLRSLADQQGAFVLKSHGPLTSAVSELLDRWGVRATYSLRDPRDIILSLMDNGALNRQHGGGVFEEHTTVENTIPFVKEICHAALTWTSFGVACLFRYRDLVSQPQAEITRLAQFLGVEVPEETVDEIADRERRTRRKGVNGFNTGLLTRFGGEMTPSQTELCNEELSAYITELGYSV
jgi:hypothetical protein